jgi:hypothetical protein
MPYMSVLVYIKLIAESLFIRREACTVDVQPPLLTVMVSLR